MAKPLKTKDELKKETEEAFLKEFGITKEAAEKSAAKEKEIDELDLGEIIEYKYDPVKAVTTEPIFFRDEDREEEEKSPLWEMEFIKNFKAEQAKENKENDLLGAKDYEKFFEPENQKKEEIRKSKENDLPGYRPWEKKYEFMDYYDQKQIFSDSMAFRLGVSQEKLDEIKKEAETKDKSNVLTATFNSGGATTSAAITGGLDILLGKPLQTLGWKNNPISAVNNYYQNLSKKKYNTMMKEADETGLGKPMEYAARFSSSLVSAIPTAIIAYLSAGTSLAAQGGSAISSILSNPAFWYSFETSLYPEYQNALMNGATENEATIVATMASLFDAGIEVGGGLEKLPKIMQNPGTRNKILKNWVKVAIDEGNESVLQDMTSELTQKIIFDHGKDWVSFDKDNNAVLNVPKSLENWLTSAAIGGILSGPLSVKSILSKNAADFAEYENFKKIIGNDFTYDLDSFKRMKYNEPEKWKIINLDYSRRADLIAHPEKALPNASIATAKDDKFVKYLFNPQSKGYAKGKNITEHLGYSKSNWQNLKNEILTKANKYPVEHKGSIAQGDKYEQRMILYGPRNNPANVLVGWLVEPDGNVHLTTAFITNKGDYKK